MSILKNSSLKIFFALILHVNVVLVMTSCKAEHGSTFIKPPQKPTPIEESETQTYTLLKGFARINLALKFRLFQIGSTFDMGYTIGESSAMGQVSLLSLLGHYLLFDGHSRFINGATNPMNMLLANIIFSKLSEDIAQKCPGQTPPPGPTPPPTQPPVQNALPEFNSSYANALLTVCNWPLDTATAHEKLTHYWLAVMGYDAPKAELEAWLEFAGSDDMLAKSAKDAVWSLNMTIFLSPYFLLNIE